MFLISTFETFTPQGSVSLSRISWMWALILSRLDRRSSSSACPQTERSVVCESWEVAYRKFSTLMIALLGSITRK